MPKATLIKGLLLNLAGKIERQNKIYLTKEDAYAQLKKRSGKDFGYDVEKWQLWFKNNTEQSFQKALFLLDQNKVVEGEKLLREVIAKTEPENHVLFAKACCCLGESLYQSNRKDEATEFLKKVVIFESDDRFNDILNYEIQGAKNLLAKIEFTSESKN